MDDAGSSCGRLDRSTYLWTDDNLSTTYLFDQLSPAELDSIASYRNYGRVCCFKGYDPQSFAFNTGAMPGDYDQQFRIMGRLLDLGLDLYGYVTLTSEDDNGVEEGVRDFVDRLQELNTNLPLRVIPLKIEVFSPVTRRITPVRERSLAMQEAAIGVWYAELNRRFESRLCTADITDVPLSGRPQ